MAANARRQRQTYAKCGPRMQQSGCDPMPRRSSNFITKWQRIGPKQRLNWVWRPFGPTPGTPRSIPQRDAGRFEPLPAVPLPCRKTPADWILRPSRHL